METQFNTSHREIDFVSCVAWSLRFLLVLFQVQSFAEAPFWCYYWLIRVSGAKTIFTQPTGPNDNMLPFPDLWLRISEKPLIEVELGIATHFYCLIWNLDFWSVFQSRRCQCDSLEIRFLDPKNLLQMIGENTITACHIDRKYSIRWRICNASGYLIRIREMPQLSTTMLMFSKSIILCSQCHSYYCSIQWRVPL